MLPRNLYCSVHKVYGSPHCPSLRAAEKARAAKSQRNGRRRCFINYFVPFITCFVPFINGVPFTTWLHVSLPPIAKPTKAQYRSTLVYFLQHRRCAQGTQGYRNFANHFLVTTLSDWEIDSLSEMSKLLGSYFRNFWMRIEGSENQLVATLHYGLSHMDFLLYFFLSELAVSFSLLNDANIRDLIW